MAAVLLLSSGGREHTLGCILVADPSVRLYTAPESPGLAEIGILYAAGPPDPAATAALVCRVGVDLMVVRPEAPLMAGVTDAVQEAGIDRFGPPVAAIELEGSKTFAKNVTRATGVPAVSARVHATPSEAAVALGTYGPPCAVKNDDLVAGKGVVATPNRAAALAYAEICGRVVVGEFLDRPEFSPFAICDGVTAVPLLSTQSSKCAGGGNTGPSADGVRAYCPLS